MVINMRVMEIDDNTIYIDDPSFYCMDDDGKKIYLGLICEALDLRELDERYDNDPYPVILLTQIVVAPKSLHPKFLERANDEHYDLNNDGIKILVTYQYAGGVPVNMESIKGSVKSKVDSETRTTIRFGQEEKIRYFRSIEDALEYAKTVYKHNSRALFGLVGFYLDKTLNLAGTTGWDIILLQAKNRDYSIF